MQNLEDLEKILTQGRLETAGSLLARGFTRDTLMRAVERGVAIQPARGIYRGPDVTHSEEDLALAALLNPLGVVTYNSAASLHGLTDEMRSITHLLLPAGYNLSLRVDNSDVAVFPYWARKSGRLTVGVEEKEILGVRVRVTDVHRTFLDFQMHGELRETEVGRKVAVSYVRDHLDAGRVRSYCRELNCSLARVQDTISTIQATLAEGVEANFSSVAP